MMPGHGIAAAALALVGAPFRLHGRDPRFGLDCVGLAMAAAERAGLRLPPTPAYRLHGTAEAVFQRWIALAGLCTTDEAWPGDVTVAVPDAWHRHVMIAVAGGHVHAHAGIGRVVLMPGPSPWRICRTYRFPPPTCVAEESSWPRLS